MESKFVNEKNLSYLNNQLSRQLNLSDKSKSEKKEMLTILLGNMRKVYNKLDKSKISDRYLPKILDTFNKYALNETIKEISNKIKITKNNDNSVFNRGKEINNSNQIHYLERPNNLNQKKNISYDINQRNFDLLNKFDQSSRYNNNIPPEKAMEILLNERNSQNEKKQPITPDFLKSKNTSKTIESFNDSSSVNDSLNMQGDTYYLSGVNLDNNFSNINFQNNEISQDLPNVDESIDTNKRLELLQKERSILNNLSEIPKPDFSKSIDENKNLINDQEEKYNQQQNQQQYQQHLQNQQQYHQQLQNQQQYQQQQYQRQQNQLQQQQYKQLQNQQQRQYDYQQDNVIGNLENIQQDDLLKLLNSYAKNNSQNINKKNEDRNEIEIKNDHEKKDNQMSDYLSELTKKQLEQLRQVQALQEQLQSHIKNQMINPNIAINENENNLSNDQLKNELVSKVKILTGQLEQEKKINIELRNRLDEEIQTKNNDNEKKLHLIEVKKEEIRSEVNNLSIKHKDIEKSYNSLINKEKFLSKLIEKNIKILQLDKLTILVDSKIHNSQSKFIYVFDSKLTNVCKIELLSYDFPLISNNINETNNKLYFKFDKNKVENSISNNSSDSEDFAVDTNEDLDVITIPEGNYDISSLIKKLNKLGATFKLIFSYNKNTNKVTIKSEKSFTLVKNENNILNLLGFENESYESNLIFTANKAYDLRKFNYVYINLLNISDKTFATVNINNSKKGSYYFDTEYIDLDKLEIEVKDEFNNLMNFCNLPFKLEFNFIFSNKNINIEDDNLIYSDLSLENKNISIP